MNNKKNIIDKIESVIILLFALILFLLCFFSWLSYPKNLVENKNENTTENYYSTQENNLNEMQKI